MKYFFQLEEPLFLDFAIFWHCKVGNIQLGSKGRIVLKDYKNFDRKTWYIWSDCEKNIVIRSKFFWTEPSHDYVNINGVLFSGQLYERIFKYLIL